MTVHLADENKLCQKNKIGKGKGRQLRVPTQHPVTVVCPQQSKQEGSAAKRPQGGGKTVVLYATLQVRQIPFPKCILLFQGQPGQQSYARTLLALGYL